MRIMFGRRSISIDEQEINSKTRSSFFIVLICSSFKCNEKFHHTNKGRSSLTSLVACKPVTVSLKN